MVVPVKTWATVTFTVYVLQGGLENTALLIYAPHVSPTLAGTVLHVRTWASTTTTVYVLQDGLEKTALLRNAAHVNQAPALMVECV